MKNIRRFLGLAVLLSLFLAGQYVYWGLYYPIRRPNPEGMTVDIPATILSYYTNPVKLAALWFDLLFGRYLQGSADIIRYIVLLFVAFPTIKYIQGRSWFKKHGIVIVWTNWAYVVFCLLFAFYAATTNGIAQTENWYGIQITCPNDGFKFWWPGTFDFATHYNAVGMIMFYAMSLGYSYWFKLTDWLRPKLCLCFDIAMTTSIGYLVAVVFEYIEMMNPDKYFNWFGNSLSDLSAIIAIFMVVMVYLLLVPKEVSTYEPEHTVIINYVLSSMFPDIVG